MKDFIIGIRKVEKATLRNVLSKVSEQKAVEIRNDYKVRKVVNVKGNKHFHTCKCRTKYPCYRGEGCSSVRSGLCEKCSRGLV